MTKEEAVARIKDHIEIHRYHERNAVKIFEALDMAIKALEQPERKKGKWIVTSEFEDCRYAKCNQCNVTQVFYYDKPLTNFCPDCGVDMRGE